MKKRIRQDDEPDGLKHNPFAALRPSGKPARPDPTPAGRGARDTAASGGTAGSGDKAAGGTRAVVRREKKGRGGKTVTRVSGLEVRGPALEEFARDMKRALGCGATVDGDDVLLQGALTERAAEWLRSKRGLRVTIGN